MGPSNIRDVLTSFSPYLDFLAISSGDGRIKIWDTVKGQLQTEFADIVSTEGNGLFGKQQKGHLSVDYTCMKWLSLEKKKKRKHGSSLLALGTGSGDVLAVDVAAGKLKWRVNNCHPGGVSSISFPPNDPSIYTAGADGFVCKLDFMTGNLVWKFQASTKSISSLSVSADGNTLATAAAQLRVFSSSDRKKLQKFSGHPGAVRCMSFSDNGKFIISSSSSERYVAIWQLDGGKKRSASCVLAMDHPAIFLDSKFGDAGNDNSGFCIVAISEMGVCYFWHAETIEELRSAKPTKVSLSIDDQFSKSLSGAIPTIFAAKLQGVSKPATGNIFLAHGLLVKPSFDKISVHSGSDIQLNSSSNGILLPYSQSQKSRKGSNNEVTALDSANAEDAVLRVPSIYSLNGKKKRHHKSSIVNDDMDINLDNPTICLEDRLRAVGILGNEDGLQSDSKIDTSKLNGIDIEANMAPKKIRAAVLAMEPSDAYDMLRNLVAMWQSRSHSGKYALPWISCILVNHGNYVLSQEPNIRLLDSLYKLTKSKGGPVQTLLQLSGRLQIVSAQIDKAVPDKSPNLLDDHEMDESDSDEVEDDLYREDDVESQSSSDDDE